MTRRFVPMENRVEDALVRRLRARRLRPDDVSLPRRREHVIDHGHADRGGTEPGICEHAAGRREEPPLVDPMRRLFVGN